MNTQFSQLPVEERIRLVEDLWDSIAQEQSAIPLTAEQATELDRRIAAFEQDQRSGRGAHDAIEEIRRQL
ncbi:addiction module protein [Parahaliea mediterranea]|uniref:addiction module protein n=1 Tax=Parahaliea mediterranea TaxID=651086 RepID=UPI000E2E7776